MNDDLLAAKDREIASLKAAHKEEIAKWIKRLDETLEYRDRALAKTAALVYHLMKLCDAIEDKADLKPVLAEVEELRRDYNKGAERWLTRMQQQTAHIFDQILARVAHFEACRDIRCKCSDDPPSWNETEWAETLKKLGWKTVEGKP